MTMDTQSRAFSDAAANVSFAADSQSTGGETALSLSERGNCNAARTCSSADGGGGTVPIDLPIFLQNTYRMIDSCDPSIASWWSDGKSFVIKDTEKLATEVIPRFFKHSKFSSLVRQLNFYGFKKVKRHDAFGFRLNALGAGGPKQQWRFRHEFFVRGRPDLMREIRKPGSHGRNAVERDEVDALKREVKQLKAQMAFMLRHIQCSAPADDDSPPAQGESVMHGKRQGAPRDDGTTKTNKRIKLTPTVSPPASPQPAIPLAVPSQHTIAALPFQPDDQGGVPSLPNSPAVPPRPLDSVPSQPSDPAVPPSQPLDTFLGRPGESTLPSQPGDPGAVPPRRGGDSAVSPQRPDPASPRPFDDISPEPLDPAALSDLDLLMEDVVPGREDCCGAVAASGVYPPWPEPVQLAQPSNSLIQSAVADVGF